MKRHFLVFYYFTTDEKDGHGNAVVTSNGNYVNQDDFLKMLIETSVVKIVKAAITNIIELNESDAKDF